MEKVETPSVPWRPELGLCALSYHTRSAGRLLLELDLPLFRLQELRRACRRRWPPPALPGQRWQRAPWGPLYLLQDSSCAFWRLLWDPNEEPAVGCFSPHEASLVTETEVHICAALRHLARASWEGLIACDLPLSPEEELEPVAGFEELAPAFAEAAERVVLVAWAFFCHAQLVAALLHGDALLISAWALRFLAVDRPFAARRTHELVVVALEFLASETAEAGARRRFLQEACAIYLRLPALPRFQNRMRRSVRKLWEQGALSVGEEEEPLGLEEILGAVLCEEAVVADESGAAEEFTPEAARAEDGIYLRFRQHLSEALNAHLNGACPLEAREKLLEGAQALDLLGGRAERILEVLASVPMGDELEEEEPDVIAAPGDVLLDVFPDFREIEVVERLMAKDGCGCCCAGPPGRLL